VAKALEGYGELVEVPLPTGARAARAVANHPGLYALLRRAFQLSRALPDELLHVFEEKVAGLPRATEIERLVVQRVGQDVFRAGLLEYWDGRCAVTGLEVPELLRASHIKPWADCTTDAERLDVFNGLLLAPHLDAVFDGGFMTIDADGGVRVSEKLKAEDARVLGLGTSLRVEGLAEGHQRYLAWHRDRLFRGNDPR
jgi:putative restriction endonuclease